MTTDQRALQGRAVVVTASVRLSTLDCCCSAAGIDWHILGDATRAAAAGHANLMASQLVRCLQPQSVMAPSVEPIQSNMRLVKRLKNAPSTKGKKQACMMR